MSILDRFKGKKEEEAPAKEKAKVVEAEKLRRSPMAKSESRPQSASGKTPKKSEKLVKKVSPKRKKMAANAENFAWQHLISTLVTEKSTLLAQDNKYMFKVHQQANKYQIKDAVENYYGVVVTKVNIIKIHPKKRIQGRTVGVKKGYKKAIVTLRAGDTITSAEGV